MNHSTPGLFVHHQLPEFTQIHVYRVGDASAAAPAGLIRGPGSMDLRRRALLGVDGLRVLLMLFRE